MVRLKFKEDFFTYSVDWKMLQHFLNRPNLTVREEIDKTRLITKLDKFLRFMEDSVVLDVDEDDDIEETIERSGNA